MNLTTTDVERFQFGGTFVNYLWGAPLESLVILYFGLDLVGVSFLAGFAALALMVPTQVRACACACVGRGGGGTGYCWGVSRRVCSGLKFVIVNAPERERWAGGATLETRRFSRVVEFARCVCR